MKIEQAIRDYIISLSTSKGMSDNTISSYSRDLNKYKKFLKEDGIEDTNRITEDHIFSFIEDLNKEYSTASINRIKTSIRSFHRFQN